MATLNISNKILNWYDPKKDKRSGVYTSFFANSLSDPCNSTDRGRISIRQHKNPNTIIVECCADTNSKIISQTFNIDINS